MLLHLFIFSVERCLLELLPKLKAQNEVVEEVVV
jgi:hypothetical protein